MNETKARCPARIRLTNFARENSLSAETPNPRFRSALEVNQKEMKKNCEDRGTKQRKKTHRASE